MENWANLWQVEPSWRWRCCYGKEALFRGRPNIIGLEPTLLMCQQGSPPNNLEVVIDSARRIILEQRQPQCSRTRRGRLCSQRNHVAGAGVHQTEFPVPQFPYSPNSTSACPPKGGLVS